MDDETFATLLRAEGLTHWTRVNPFDDVVAIWNRELDDEDAAWGLWDRLDDLR